MSPRAPPPQTVCHTPSSAALSSFSVRYAASMSCASIAACIFARSASASSTGSTAGESGFLSTGIGGLEPFVLEEDRVEDVAEGKRQRADASEGVQRVQEGVPLAHQRGGVARCGGRRRGRASDVCHCAERLEAEGRGEGQEEQQADPHRSA
eukprot:CAMPEP_0184393020 /NCGR_PEP_ID=MMETSP0007-20130409/31916_1 /TAXON_ID=97485 /ORGANISM="Prymnesium parvum, Strain Texoma1" /LENGTH=151 /DNA_ID=CAMNT_0026743827 /DNA_START=151 /DNA_END=601 /DNA_ORIENTATION=+